MSAFEAGDIVECVDDWTTVPPFALQVGQRCRVIAVDEEAQMIYVSHVQNVRALFLASRFRLVTPDTRPRYVRANNATLGVWAALSKTHCSAVTWGPKAFRSALSKRDAHALARILGGKVVVGRKP